MDRITILEQFIAEDPGDPFNFYALALEYLKVDPAKARHHFEKLLGSHPEYLPTYYPLGQLLYELKEHDLAGKIFQKGMEIARAKNEMKTFRELQSAYNDLQFSI